MNLRLTTCEGVGPFSNTRQWSDILPTDRPSLAQMRPKTVSAWRPAGPIGSQWSNEQFLHAHHVGL